ncbi:MAG: hypothetical protein WAO02_16630 [Verrucomicrobiia bacterium]
MNTDSTPQTSDAFAEGKATHLIWMMPISLASKKLLNGTLGCEMISV